MDNFEPVTDWEYERLMELMQANNSKSFVQRILTPGKYPTLDQGDGSHATHRMAWTQAGDKYYVYPTVLLEKNGKLKDYGDAAWDAVRSTGNYMEFNDPEEASWFAQKYKGAWGGQKNKPPK
jgi:hypothetical protein